MFGRIVVALDGSELAREAFEYSAAMADRAHIPLRAVYVVEKIPARTGGGAEDGLALVSEAIRTCDAYCHERGLDFDVTIVAGPLMEFLSRYSRVSDLVAVGMKGRSCRTGIGSTTRWLIHHARCPVMIVNGPPPGPPEHLVAVFDGSPAAVAAITLARSVATQLRWSFTVLAIPDRRLDPDAVVEAARELAPAAEVVAGSSPDEDRGPRIDCTATGARNAVLVVGGSPDWWFRELLGNTGSGRLPGALDTPVILAR